MCLCFYAFFRDVPSGIFHHLRVLFVQVIPAFEDDSAKGHILKEVGFRSDIFRSRTVFRYSRSSAYQGPPR